MSQPKLSIEILNGPLDGQTVTIAEQTAWSKEGDGPLSFPWDETLGSPQARFQLENGQWWLEHVATRRSTYHNMEPINGKVKLEKGDLFKSATVWLVVQSISADATEA